MAANIVDIIRETGVVGAGGAGLPTHVKAEANVDTVLVNGASCEPLLMSDPYLMEAEVDTMIRGLEAIMDCTGAKKGIICLKGKHAKAVKAVQEAVARDGSGRLECFVLKDFYPAGDEQVLVYEVLGRTVPERGIPLQVGAVVSNTESLFNVALAMDGKPVTHRYLTVAGEIKNPMVVKVPVGTLVSDVLEFAGGPTISDYKVVDGGPMMGRVLPDTNQPVTKTTSGLLVLPPNHNVVAGKVMDPEKIRRITNTVCCQCSRCTDLCPRNLLGHSLHPHKLMRVIANNELNTEAAKEALLCSECGICEKFSCPMMISPREVNAQIKQILMKERVTWESKGNELKTNPFRESRAIPTKRLIQRLNLSKYDGHPEYAGEYTPSVVNIRLGQHIGAPAQCVVSAGDKVSCGDLIGEIPEGAMGARVHASIDGTVESVENGVVVIKK
ncbi:4Fe-4S dicluster domain-containing protein [Maridesulfovibrio salexigens]|uniref:Respiratory-chain NADH dehydrogenase domain 51 kDa subunit n=1 Tax=Maridesulfovibrio salexigens (strain ATCC 14822 / DSM 2638 / NCIMB 8403 / VKM B-1763) TaxID=526222 RepID=C6BX68_MARSD|nr:4Fe-4S dicluster domain-containing protein [Maridesulfovibrio salexigens]ACS78548.1 Respiratory-chain NADH dehydrogenase domain 51 kDa subunit [Maridesulfovibrio salexigens DSM 2638]